jgi:3-methylfumaryl-CoA hydratase
MPDVDLPRRMWAGGTLRSLHPVSLGEPAQLRSEIMSITEKRGRSGRLVFVTVGHAVLQGDRRCVEEEQVIVYREPAPPSAASSAGTGGDGAAGRESGRPNPVPEWSETFLPTTVTLFQFSALTFNGHRIHYDHPYVTQQEGYPGLLVHGPLTALLLLDAAQRHGARPVEQFRYRALAPLFVDQPIMLAGEPAESGSPKERVVQALALSGAVAMRGWVT